MQSDRPKVLHEAGGLPLLDWVLRAFTEAGISNVVCVVGSGADTIRAKYEDLSFAYQAERLGSGHAVMQALPQLTGPGYTFIAAGDMPLLRGSTIRAMISEAEDQHIDCVLLTAELEDPTGYGRIIRGDDGNVEMIVEHRDATGEQQRVREVNASCYCIRTELLRELLPKLETGNAQGEYYLTDIVRLINEWGGTVGTHTAPWEECLGVNDRVQLAEASHLLYSRTCDSLMRSGVTIMDPACTYIDPETTIGRDTIVYPGVTLEAGCEIGSQAVLYPGSRFHHSKVGDRTEVQNSVLLESEVGPDSRIGPYAYLRPGAKVGSHCRIGDFVELKNCSIGDGTKVSHLTYIGDADFGRDINVGCGVVVVNYDGHDKFRSTVHDDAFIGCNTNLISPVEVGRGAYIAAGTTVTEDVPEDVLAIGRSRQTVIPDWQDKRRKDKSSRTPT
ncbi:MAG: bifunctional UDP-N-acetylglucosamine diphosphorylase/glucosamine-1-phosphate N-acetyltransferase GlmU [Clostridia bacterium]|nr:bifunctional UDP-N-acetylglucosamine diphosphorylase/glucosamine-1-phosphate N-acetyltransferase GlmU [Clostridia bacterium]